MGFQPNEPRDLTRLRKLRHEGVFAQMATKRVEAFRLGLNAQTHKKDLDLPWKPGGRFHKHAGALARRCLKALKISREAPGMIAKVDRGEKTFPTGGRILTTGTVLEATAAFAEPIGGVTKILYVLRIKDVKGHIWDEKTRVTHVHKLEPVQG